jgi:hypothetical protein
MVRTRSRTSIALLTAALLASLAITAEATEKTVQDPKGDQGDGKTDIKSINARTTKHTIIFTFIAYADFKTKRAPCVGIGQAAVKHPQGDHFNICGDGKIEDFQHGRTAGHAKVKRPDRHTIVYVVSRSLPGTANKFAWSVVVRYGNCLQQGGRCDMAPDGSPGLHVVQKY